MNLLVREPLSSPAQIGARLGMTDSSVERRLEKLGERGALDGFKATPAPAVFHREGYGLGWQDQITPEEVLELDEVVWSARSVDGVTAAMAFVNDRDAFRQNAEERFGSLQRDDSPLYPSGPFDLDAVSWLVMKAMIEHPMGTTDQLSSKTGVERSVLEQKRDEMLGSGAVLVQPMLRVPSTGPLYCHLWVTMTDRGVTDEVLARLGHVFVVTDYGESLYLFCEASSLHEFRELLTTIEEIEGVDQTVLVLNDQFLQHDQRLHTWIDYESGQGS